MFVTNKHGLKAGFATISINGFIVLLLMIQHHDLSMTTLLFKGSLTSWKNL